MRSLRFLLSRRWILFAITVLLLTYLAWWLGQWQFDRLDERRDSNATSARNEQADPVPVDRVLAPGQPVAEGDEWRLVRATGEYAVEDTVVVRYRTRDSTSGVDVVVPLVLADGTALLVDRGWLMTGNAGTRPDSIPEPPPGEVTVTGWVRADATGDSTQVSDLSTRAISSEVIGEALERPLYGGFLELKSEDPPPAEALLPVELPDRGNGPHFFYGLQWWFFGLLALFGFGYLAYDEWRGQGRRGTPDRRQTGSDQGGSV